MPTSEPVAPYLAEHQTHPKLHHTATPYVPRNHFSASSQPGISGYPSRKPVVTLSTKIHIHVSYIHQHKYATEVLDCFSDYIPYPIATPAERNVKLSLSSHPSSEAEKVAMKAIPYREAVGSVVYLMVGTRPDMAFYMREVSQFLANPGIEHWKAVVRGLKYLSGAKDYGLLLGGLSNMTSENLADSLTACSDSDYANCPDSRRSVGGYVPLLANSPISWLSRKHHTVVLDNRGRLYRPVPLHARDDILQAPLQELGFATTQAKIIHEDNHSCIKICYNPELHGRSKHIHVRYCFVQEKVERHEFTVVTAIPKR